MNKIQAVGIDIEEVKRFKKVPFRRNAAFYKKIFTAREIKYCLSKDDPYPHFTARFAAKEAVLKCLRSTIYKVKDIEVINDKAGIPSVKVKNRKGEFLVSLSHTNNQAAAIVIWSN